MKHKAHLDEEICDCKKLFCAGCNGKDFQLHKRIGSEMIEVVCVTCDSRLMKLPDTSIVDFNFQA